MATCGLKSGTCHVIQRLVMTSRLYDSSPYCTTTIPLETIRKRIKKGPSILATLFQTCNSPSAVLASLQQQVKGMKSDIPLDDSVTARTDSDSSETKGLIKETWRTFTVGLSLYQTMNVLHVSSSTHGPLKRVLAWYANLPEIRSHVYFAGILSCETDLPGVSVLFIVRVLTHNLFLSTGDHSSAHLSMLLDRRWALMITTCSTHRVEPGSVVVAIIYSFSRPTKVLVGDAHTQAVALVLGSPNHR
jgi:hypothetical protein